MTSDTAFDTWYAAQRHQLSNEQVCRLIWNRAWQTAHEALSVATGSAEPAGKVCMDSNFPDTEGWARRQFLAGGTRFKLASSKNGAKFDGFPAELSGRWVALVAADNDEHLRSATPASAPAADERSRFEAEVRSRGWSTKPSPAIDLGFLEARVNYAWFGWQARAQASEPVSAPAAAPTWRCFHCSAEFTDADEAMLHFGKNELVTPACQIDGGVLAELRRAEAELARYREEDSDKDREMYGLRNQHQLDLRRAEEAGYAKALKDTNYQEPGPSAPADAREGGSWINADDVRRLARELDVVWNGVVGAAAAPALCDVVAQIARELPPLMADLHQVREILALRAEEGDSVTILCDNPEFGGPNCAIEVSASWTDYADRRFSGDTLRDCLRAATDAKNAAADRAMGAGGGK